jgi:hypothetical protein
LFQPVESQAARKLSILLAKMGTGNELRKAGLGFTAYFGTRLVRIAHERSGTVRTRRFSVPETLPSLQPLLAPDSGLRDLRAKSGVPALKVARRISSIVNEPRRQSGVLA